MPIEFSVHVCVCIYVCVYISPHYVGVHVIYRWIKHRHISLLFPYSVVWNILPDASWVCWMSAFRMFDLLENNIFLNVLNLDISNLNWGVELWVQITTLIEVFDDIIIVLKNETFKNLDFDLPGYFPLIGSIEKPQIFMSSSIL